MNPKGQPVLIRASAVLPDGVLEDARVLIQDGVITGIHGPTDQFILQDGPPVLELDFGAGRLLPGFIDLHTHDDRAVLVNPTMKNKVSQGVTTVVTGNCGVSLAPLKIDRRPPAPLDLICDTPEGFYGDFASYLKALDDAPAAVNVLAQVGHSSLRVGAVADLTRAASSSEIKVMRKKLEESLEAGAIGFSTGLFYPPSQAAPTEEVIELGKALHDHAGLHTTHMRDEANHITDSLEETFRIGREADIPVVISHHKCSGADNHGRSAETLPLIDAAMKKQRVGLDVYPYIASSTMLNPQRMMGASRVLVTWSVPHPEHAGRDLDDIAKEMGLPPLEAAEKLREAAGLLASEPQALQLRYLQTLIDVAGDKNSTIVFPLPMDLIEPFMHRARASKTALLQGTGKDASDAASPRPTPVVRGVDILPRR